jgi:HPt (histidine-containing phosphotransfer) domain-containing protein
MLVHSLKGASGTLGATAIYRNAALLESALAAADTPDAAIAAGARELHEDLGALVAALNASLPADTAAISTSWEESDVDAALDRLEELLAAADFDAAAVFRDAAPLLTSALGAPAVATFATPLHDYDYPAALRVLREVRARARDARGTATAGAAPAADKPAG